MEKNILITEKDNFKFIGRSVLTDDSLELTWSNSGIDFDFRGDGFLIFFKQFQDDQPVYIKLIVDGAEQRFAVSDGREAVIAEGIGDGCHHARVIRITEGEKPLSLRAVRLTGKHPEMLEKPEDKNVKLEFIGDSLTCGYGILGDVNSPGFFTFEEDSTRAYAYLTAQALDADANFVCASGKGMVNNCMGARGYEVPLWYDYTSRTGKGWDHSSFEPDVIVINIGTNDAWGGASKEEFKSVSTAFLRRLRQLHPHSALLWAFGFMGTDLVLSVKELMKDYKKEDPNSFFYSIPPIFGKNGETGAVGHPSAKANVRLARSLTRIINKILTKAD
ncbi:MAG TPA: GDSL-type esterase/lipase family protein [Bacillota bacterium]|nr:GDSL-type esterase/lipase family protein [Bacillota bacterium]